MEGGNKLGLLCLKGFYVHYVCAMPDFTKSFALECDASSRVLGVVSLQDIHPFSFTNKQLYERNLGKSIYEKEMMVILHIVETW